jgi:4-amino-4-deoxy-L-arabinose transferase-like glycosyltransferase
MIGVGMGDVDRGQFFSGFYCRSPRGVRPLAQRTDSKGLPRRRFRLYDPIMTRIRLALLTIFLVLASALPLLKGIPTFDLDEALYRRVAEEMKITGNAFTPTWDGEPFFHKPPVYYWTIVASSALLGDPSDRVSAAASRLPGYVFTWLTALLIALAWPALNARQGKKFRGLGNSKWFPVFIFSLALFPVTFAATVFFDPFQTFALTPALLAGTWYFFGESSRSSRGWACLVFGLSMFAGASIKGLQALVIPGLAFIACMLLEWRKNKSVSTLKEDLKFGIKSLLVCLTTGTAFFSWMHFKAGPAFTREFFVVQHFQRGTTAMEGHSGFLGFYFLIFAVGAGILGSILILRSKRWQDQPLFPWVWIGVFLLFFSAMSTQLPNYIWPVWPALALAATLRLAHGLSNDAFEPVSRRRRFAACLPLIPLALVFGLLAYARSVWPRIPFLPEAEIARLTNVILPGSLALGAWLGLAACTLTAGVVFRARTSKNLLSSAGLAQLLLVLAFSLGLMPAAADLFPGATERLALWADENLREADCLQVEGPRSAVVSSAYRRGRVKCIPGKNKWILAPVWNEQDCAKNQLPVYKTDQFMILCGTPLAPFTD